jgi:hypothetical protein
MLDLSKWMSWLWPNSWGWVRITLPYSDRFYAPACYHDLWYTEGGNEEDKNRIDLKFYFDCLCECDSNMSEAIAYIYYYILKCYWYLYFNYK